MRKLPLHDVIVKPVSRTPRDSDGAHARSTQTETHHSDVERSTQPPVETKRRPTDVDYQDNGLGAVEPPERTRRSVGERKWLFAALGIGAIVILSSFVLSLLFAGATVTVYPKQDTPVVTASFNIEANGEGGTLAFERMVRERTANQTVIALGEEDVEDRAEGQITIFSEFEGAPQRLIKNTRFKSTEGRIYRIRESVEIPGPKNDGTPGSIEITAYAEEPGEAYNMGPDDFTIPGLVGLPQEGKVYARSTSNMSGGFVGVKRSVDESDRTRALEELESKLRDELLAAAFESNDKPQGYLLFKEAVFFEFNALPDEIAETDKVVLQLSGRLHAILLPEARFAERLAQLTIAAYDGSLITIESPEELTVSLEPIDGPTGAARTPWEVSEYTVSVQGKAHFIWQYDEAQLKADLAGKEKQILDTPFDGGIREGYPGIDNIQVSVRPFWKKTFPESVDDIVVIRELDS